MSEVSGMGRYRAFVHEDGEYLSIGFEDTNDTLLKMPDGERDRATVVAWVEAVNRTQGAVEALEQIKAKGDGTWSADRCALEAEYALLVIARTAAGGQS